MKMGVRERFGELYGGQEVRKAGRWRDNENRLARRAGNTYLASYVT